MSSRELNRVEVMGRVASGDLKLNDAAVMLELSYRQTKRLWRRYRQGGSKGGKHGDAGRGPKRSKTQKLCPRGFDFDWKKKFPSRGGRIGAAVGGQQFGARERTRFG